MAYFITGGTGFIGRFLIQKILEETDAAVYVLVRPQSRSRFDQLLQKLNTTEARVKAVFGDLSEKQLGISDNDIQALKGKIAHFFHLAAIYDLRADEESQMIANVSGTRHAMQCAQLLQARQFNHVSSIAAAGMYKGTFREDMFAEAENLEHPYFNTKHVSEGIIREECQIPWRVFRPGLVVGHSETGEIDKIDGPYYFFKLIQKLRHAVPQWMPTVGVEGGRLNIVPVDYVVNAMFHIAHKPDLEARCFHLVAEDPPKLGELLNIFAHAGHAPEMAMRIDTRMFGFIPAFIRQGILSLAPVQRMVNQVFTDLGIPRDAMQFIGYSTKFDARDAERALAGSGIECPSLESYAWRLWDYWERHLDPDLFIDRTLAGTVKDKVVVVTGASSGIGKASAMKLADAGAKVVLVARTLEKLEETLNTIKESGGQGFLYQCDVSDMNSCDAFIEQVLKDHDHVDVLVNNAGRSIRRAIASSYDRFHDFERTMQLNYFGALRLSMGLLPVMDSRKGGHIINISSIGVLTNAPRFSAYVASKAAMDAFSRCAAAEFSDRNVHFTTINMPLVRTPMIAPTKIYENVPTISPDEAAQMVCQAIIYKPKRIATRLGLFAQVMYQVAPKLTEIVMSTGFRMFPDSAASQNKSASSQIITPELLAFAHLMKGVHW